MKKFFFIPLLLFTLLAAPALADENESNTFLDWIGVGGAGCGISGVGVSGEYTSPRGTGQANTPCNVVNPQEGTGLFAAIACRVMSNFNNGVVPLYCNIVQNPEYVRAIDAALALYVVLFGFSFIFGLVPMTAGQLVAKLLRMLIIYAIVINADVYFNLIYNTVIGTPQDAVLILLNSGADTSGIGYQSGNFFDFVDKGMYEVIHNVFYQKVHSETGETYDKSNLKILLIGLAIWQLAGDLPGGLFYAVVVMWVMSYFSIMIRYLLAMLSLMFVLMLGPLFIPTMLFDRSRYLGEEWIYMMLNFIMQIVLVVAFVLMVQGFFIDFYNLIKTGLSDAVTMDTGTDQHSISFNDNTSSPTSNQGGTYRVEESTGFTTATADSFFTKVFGGSYKDKMPNLLIQLIEMCIIVLSAVTFLAYVPSLAALLIGRPRFTRIFVGNQFGPKDKTTQARLIHEGSKNEPLQNLASQDSALDEQRMDARLGE